MLQVYFKTFDDVWNCIQEPLLILDSELWLGLPVSRSTKTYFSRILYTGIGPEVRSRYLRIKKSHCSWGCLIFEYFISEYASATATSSSFEFDGQKWGIENLTDCFYCQSEGNMYFLWNSILAVSLVRSISWSFGTMNLIPFRSAFRFGIFFGWPSRAKSVQVFIIRSDNSFSSCVQYFPCANELSKTNVPADPWFQSSFSNFRAMS